MRLTAKTLDDKDYEFDFVDIGEMYVSDNVFYVKGFVPLKISTVKPVEERLDSLADIMDALVCWGCNDNYTVPGCPVHYPNPTR